MAKFKGFTTINAQRTAKTLTDQDLALRDLRNHFYTRVGSRLGEPLFGTHIYDYVFEINDDITQNDVTREVRRVVSADPRWTLINTDVSLGEHEINVRVTMSYNNSITPTELLLTYNNENL